MLVHGSRGWDVERSDGKHDFHQVLGIHPCRCRSYRLACPSLLPLRRPRRAQQLRSHLQLRHHHDCRQCRVLFRLLRPSLVARAFLPSLVPSNARFPACSCDAFAWSSKSGMCTLFDADWDDMEWSDVAGTNFYWRSACKAELGFVIFLLSPRC